MASMSKTLKHLSAAVAGTVATLVLTEPAVAAWDLNLREGVTSLSQEAYHLHMQILYWCCGIAVIVFGAMIYSLVKFRKSVHARPDVNMTHSTTAEVVWTVIPIVILVVMAVPAARALIKIEDTRNAELTIKVTGYQWKW